MWSDLVDDKGRRRAGIFYKAAFYDRAAHISADRRYGYNIDYEKLDEGIAQAFVTDGGREVHRLEGIEFNLDDHSLRYDAYNEACDRAKAWLTDTYPEWKNSAAYWD